MNVGDLVFYNYTPYQEQLKTKKFGTVVRIGTGYIYVFYEDDNQTFSILRKTFDQYFHTQHSSILKLLYSSRTEN